MFPKYGAAGGTKEQREEGLQNAWLPPFVWIKHPGRSPQSERFGSWMGGTGNRLLECGGRGVCTLLFRLLRNIPKQNKTLSVDGEMVHLLRGQEDLSSNPRKPHKNPVRL